MAIPHLSAKPIGRAQGRSATGAAAYRAGMEIVDERTGLVHDFTRKGGVLHTELILPGGGTAERAEFWNRIESHHKRGDAVLVREVEVALPKELSKEQRQELAVSFGRELADRYGVAADVALHAPKTVTDRDLEKKPDQYWEIDPDTGRRHNANWHAHIMLSACHVSPDGTLGKKAVELDPIHCQRHKLENMAEKERPRWNELVNSALERAGKEARVDLRSLEAQRVAAIERGEIEKATKLDRLPTVHLGPNVVQMEQRGIRTERGDQGREITQRNAQIINLNEVRQRIEAARAAYERDNGNGRDRTADWGDGRAAARAGAEQSGGHAGKSDIGRLGQIPPAFARGRLRNLSELGVVRFPERGEMLLPRDVPRNVEHQRAEPNNELRRGNDGLTAEKPATARELVQRDLNADLLRRAVADREPIQAANDPSPEAVKQEWQNEKARQFTLIVNRAKELHTRTADVMERQEGKLASHDQARPAEPAGLFAGIKKAAHDQALAAWRGVRTGLEKRWTQLQNRLHLIGDYMRKAGPYEQPTRGERLAEKKAAQARPELAANFQQVIEKEKAARIAEQRAKIEQRRTGNHKERSSMKEETIEELKQRIDANTEKAAKAADKAERAELEKIGNQVMQLSALDAEQKVEENQIGKTQSDALARELNAGTDKGDQAKEERKRELLERFKDKARSDRDNDRGRGR